MAHTVGKLRQAFVSSFFFWSDKNKCSFFFPKNWPSFPELLQTALGPQHRTFVENRSQFFYRPHALPVTQPTVSQYWKVEKILLLQHNQHFYLDVSVSIRDLRQKKYKWLILLLVLATIVMQCGKKSVVRVAQRVAPRPGSRIAVLLFEYVLPLWPSSTFVGLSVQNSGGRPIDHVVIMRCMVSQCRFVLLRQTWCTLVSGERFASYGFHAEPHVQPISFHVTSLSWQEPEEELNKLLQMKVSDKDRNVNVKMLVVLK